MHGFLCEIMGGIGYGTGTNRLISPDPGVSPMFLNVV